VKTSNLTVPKSLHFYVLTQIAVPVKFVLQCESYIECCFNISLIYLLSFFSAKALHGFFFNQHIWILAKIKDSLLGTQHQAKETSNGQGFFVNWEQYTGKKILLCIKMGTSGKKCVQKRGK
jgi:hypothetical protein